MVGIANKARWEGRRRRALARCGGRAGSHPQGREKYKQVRSPRLGLGESLYRQFDGRAGLGQCAGPRGQPTCQAELLTKMLSLPGGGLARRPRDTVSSYAVRELVDESEFVDVRELIGWVSP